MSAARESIGARYARYNALHAEALGLSERTLYAVDRRAPEVREASARYATVLGQLEAISGALAAEWTPGAGRSSSASGRDGGR